MKNSSWLAGAMATISLTFASVSLFAQKVQVSILYRQDSDVLYHAVVPGYSGQDADITGACSLDPDPANCPAYSSATTGEPSYMLIGTTLSLGLPDGRIAVVNCVSRHSATGNYVNRHSCGMPLSEHAEAEFVGQSARLKWAVTPDGRKTDSETYRVVAMLDKRPANGNIAKAGEGPSH